MPNLKHPLTPWPTRKQMLGRYWSHQGEAFTDQMCWDQAEVGALTSGVLT